MAEQMPLFDERFLEQYTGHALLKDPVTALVELIANSWDAGATRVDIHWPENEHEKLIISDNGESMTEEEFEYRWRKFSYNRLKEQGALVVVPGYTNKRKAYGRNGVGRFAAFCFGNPYTVTINKQGKQVEFKVSRGTETVPLIIEKTSESKASYKGTEISVLHDGSLPSITESIKSELAMRFLTDPSFSLYFNGELLDFQNLPTKNVKRTNFQIDGIGKVSILLIDTQKTDRTMKQHGIAWHVNGRLVGECTWKGTGHESFVDGRRIEAKRYIFIVFADCLEDSVNESWTAFRLNCENYKKAKEAIDEKIKECLEGLTEERRSYTKNIVRDRWHSELKMMSLISKDKWNKMLDRILTECPSLTERDLEAVLGVMANLELSQSRYSLLHKLHGLEPGQLDDLHDLMKEWTVDAAKAVLDELQVRIKLVDELRIKTSDTETLEVQELQPLFQRGLWIFGPEFETIEFTSNEGMTKVIQKLFKGEQTGSLNRPDFAIVPDGSVGLYSYPSYDDETGSENGVAKLVLVDLKKPNVRVSDKQKSECWKWVKELYDRGVLSRQTPVRCFILSNNIDDDELEPRKQGNAYIIPLHYQTILGRAKSRLLNLYEKVKDAPFLALEENEGDALDLEFISEGEAV